MSRPLSKKACEIIMDIWDDKSERAPEGAYKWEERGNDETNNQFFRKMRFEFAGDYMCGHKHLFGHNTIVFRGAIRVLAIRPNGEEIDHICRLSPPGKFPERNEGFVFIRADTHHEIIALEDCTEAWCCFSHKNEHGEDVDAYEGVKSAYSALPGDLPSVSDSFSESFRKAINFKIEKLRGIKRG